MVAKTLNRKGIPPPGGHGLWKTSAIKAIVENPIYRGLFEWNSRTEAKYNFIQNGTMVPKPRSAKAQVFLREEQDRIRVPLPELAIVTPELWHRVHAARARRADVHYVEQKRLNNRSPLGGRIYGGQCGAKMYGDLWTKTKLVAGNPHTYVDDVYVCSTYDGNRDTKGRIRQVCGSGGTEFQESRQRQAQRLAGGERPG